MIAHYRHILFTVILVALLSESLSFAQDRKIERLKRQLPALNDKARIDCLNALSAGYMALQIFDSARACALQAVTKGSQLKYANGEGQGYNNLASIEYELSDFAAMEHDSKMAIELFNRIEDFKNLGKSYVLLGSAIWAQSKFDSAKEMFNKAIQLFRQVHDTLDYANTYGVLALVEEERGNYEASFEYCMEALKLNNSRAFIALGQLYADVGDYETALEYYFTPGDTTLLRHRYLKIGEAFYLQKEYDSAIHYYNLFIKARSIHSKQLLSKPYALLGSVYLDEKKYDSALFYLTTSLHDFEAVNNRNWVMRVLLELGRTYRQTGDLNSAMESIQNLLVLADNSGARQYIRDAHYLLYELFDQQKKPENAYRHLKKYTALSNAINIEVSARKLAFYKTAHEREQAQLKIDLLSNQKQLQLEELKQTAQQRKFLVIGLLGLALIGTVLVRNILLKKRNEQDGRQLAENELKIQKLETRKRLGELEMQVLRGQMNPHFIFNSLNSINRFILQNNKAEASEYLTKFSRLVRMILQNSQSKLITLDQELQLLDLYLSLEVLRFDHHFSYEISVNDNIDATMAMVPPLIIQPYSENAVWHGLMHKEEKGHLTIEVFPENDLLAIRITDDGVGRAKASALEDNADPSHKSMGLEITSQRIAMAHKTSFAGSAVAIHDLMDPNGVPCGTEVVIKLPIAYG